MNKEFFYVPSGATLGEKLRSLRLLNNLTPKKVIKLLYTRKFHYSVQSVYKWEEDILSPPLQVVHALAKIYKSDFSYIIEDEEIEVMHLTKREKEILELIRTDDLFHNIIILIMRRIEFGT